MCFKVKYVLKCVRLKQIPFIETTLPQPQIRMPQQPGYLTQPPQTQTSTLVDEHEPQELNFVDESEPQQQAPSIIDDTLPLEPEPQQQAPRIINDT